MPSIHNVYVPLCRFHSLDIIHWAALHQGADSIVLEIGRKQAEGAQNARIRRNHYCWRAQQLCQLSSMHRPGTTKGDEGKGARVVPFFHGDHPQGADHVVIDDAHHASGNGMDIGHRSLQWKDTDLAFVRHGRATCLDEADIGTGAAHVDTDRLPW